MSEINFVDRIVEVAKHNFGDDRMKALLTGSFGMATSTIKTIFGDLGKRLGLQVAAAGYKGAEEGEWLYDMVWFTLGDGMLARQVMVMESEMKPGGGVKSAANVDGDFMKLVQARAEVRIWLTACPNAEMTEKHIANCKLQATRFASALSGDTYVFIVYNWTTEKTSIELFSVKPE